MLCYELEVSPTDLSAPPHASTELHTAVKGSPIYAACCELLYDYYREAHATVSPISVDADTFCATLPETVMYCISDGKPIHCAFIAPDESDCEIAYVATADLSSFCSFTESLVQALFQKCGTLTAECDDTDPAAMILKSMFRTSSEHSYDTYILE